MLQCCITSVIMRCLPRTIACTRRRRARAIGMEMLQCVRVRVGRGVCNLQRARRAKLCATSPNTTLLLESRACAHVRVSIDVARAADCTGNQLQHQPWLHLEVRRCQLATCSDLCHVLYTGNYVP